MKRIRLTLFALAVLIIGATSVPAQRDRDTYNPGNQTFEVSGQVTIAGSNAAARDVPVRLERFSGGIIDQIATDARGRFRFGNLPRGYYKVIINSPGFAPVQQDADLTLLFKSYMVFTLTPNDSTHAYALLGTIDVRVPANAREEFGRGREALAKKSQQAAITHFKRAVAIYPEFFEAELLIGIAFMDLRDWPSAEAAFRRSLEIKPDKAEAVLALGEVYWRQKRNDEAERMLLEGLKLNEKNWHGYFTLARLYWDQGDAMKAGRAIGHTLQLKPNFAEAHLLAGNILLKFGQQQRALLEYQDYVRLAPKGEYALQARDLIQKLKGTK